MSVIINPGSGPVDGATEDNAIDNIKHFIADLETAPDHWLRWPELDDDGRYGFMLWKSKNGWDKFHGHYVQMPGLPLDQVRYIGSPQNIWHFPRLYVDGSSWVWAFALSVTDFRCGDDES